MNVPSLATRPESPIVEEVRRAFASTLTGWAQDLLVARSQGLLSMSWQPDPETEESPRALAA
jgi:hypothetical protein